MQNICWAQDFLFTDNLGVMKTTINNYGVIYEFASQFKRFWPTISILTALSTFYFEMNILFQSR